MPLDAVGEALLRLRDLIERHDLAINFPAEVRFVPADSAWMSPAFGHDSCEFGAYMAPAPDVLCYFRAFEEAMIDLGGRPHPG